MPLRPLLWLCLSLAALSAILVWPFIPHPEATVGHFRLELRLASAADGDAQLYWDTGDGFAEHASSRARYVAGDDAPLAFPLPTARIVALRLDPATEPGEVTVRDMRIVSRRGELVREVSVQQLLARDQIERLHIADDTATITTTPTAHDPVLHLGSFEPLDLAQRAGSFGYRWFKVAGLTFAVMLALVLSGREVHRRVAARFGSAYFSTWTTQHPVSSIALLALLATAASSYPVIFLGKSLVSPSLGAALLYPGSPTLPGVADAESVDLKQADVGALMWQHVPFSMIQHRALLEGEPPLWNRYNSSGVSLLGQGQSSLGDPLHVLPILANGAAWAWDFKFLCAKWLLAAGVGLIVWQLTRHWPAVVITGVSAPFIGFFVYRVNHPAIFSLCYSPWVLYAWLRIQEAPTSRTLAPWGLGWLVANVALLCSGTAKEAVILLVAMNGAGALVLINESRPWSSRLRRLAWMSGLGALFLLITAPHWLLFLHTWSSAYTTYDDAQAFQVPPGLFVGLFDEIFYRPFEENEIVINPSANFLTLTGLLWLGVRWRTAWRDRRVRALLLASLLPLLLVFGVISPAVITRLPVLAGIQHVDNTFSCVLVVLGLVLAGCGWQQAWTRLRHPGGLGELVVVLLLIFLGLAVYFGTAQSILRSAYAGYSWPFRVSVSSWIVGYAVSLGVAAAVGLLVLAVARRQGRWSTGQVILLLGCAGALLWRHGLHVTTNKPGYVVTPTSRADLHASSPSIEYLQQATATTPMRVAGINDTFFPGWSAAYALEGITGPDALMNRRYRELLVAAGVERVWDWRYVVRPDSLTTLGPVYDALNVGLLVAHRGEHVPPSSAYELVLRSDARVYRSATAWPRAFFVAGVSTYDDLANFAARLRRGGGPFAAVDSRDPNLPSALPRHEGNPPHMSATNYQLTTNSTTFEIEAPAAGVVVLLEAYQKNDFKVEINGRPSGYFRVNHAFKGVVLPKAGRYRICYTYRPALFVLGSYLAAGGLLLAIGGFIFARRHSVALT